MCGVYQQSDPLRHKFILGKKQKRVEKMQRQNRNVMCIDLESFLGPGIKLLHNILVRLRLNLKLKQNEFVTLNELKE